MTIHFRVLERLFRVMSIMLYRKTVSIQLTSVIKSIGT